MAKSSRVSAQAPPATRSPLWLAGVLVVVFIWALPNLSYPIGRDQATFCTIGQGLLRGQQLYRDLWDNKPPGIFWIFALVVKVFGPVMWSVGLVDILWLLAISCCIYFFAERYLGTVAAALAVVFNAAWHLEAGDLNATQAETFLMLFVFTSYFLVAREGPWLNLRRFVAGLLFGAAFWIKYNAVALLAIVLWLPYLDAKQLDAQPRRLRLVIPRRRWLLKMMVFMAGFITLGAAVLAYFWLTGSWAALKEVQFEVLPRYRAMIFEHKPNYGLFFLWVLLAIPVGLGPLTVAATVAALATAWKRRELAIMGPIFFAAGLAFVSVVLQIYFRSYYFEICNPFFAMVWGYLGLRFFERFRAVARDYHARGRPIARLVVWGLFAFVVFWPLANEVVLAVGRYRDLADWKRNSAFYYAGYDRKPRMSHLAEQLRVIEYVRKDSVPSDKVFVWGCDPLIYFGSQRSSPTRFICNYPLISPWGPPAWRSELMRSLKKSPPRFIVIARDDQQPGITFRNWDSEGFLQTFPELAGFIRNYYRLNKNFLYFSVYIRQAISPYGEGGSVNPPNGGG